MKLIQYGTVLTCALAMSAGSYAMSKKPAAPKSQPQAAGFTGSVDSLAQQCFSIQSPNNGNYMQRFDQGGLVDDGLSYRFANIAKNSAARFYFKPTMRGRFMLTDQNGRYFASHLPAEISAGKSAGKFAEWQVNKEGNDRFSLKGTGLNMKVRHRTNKGTMYFFDLLNPFNWNSENQFKLVPATGCKSYPEVATNVRGNPDALKGDVRDSVRGFIDAHTHITSYEFMGGKFMAGSPFSRWGVEDALRDSKDKHGPNGSLDLIGNLYTFNNPNNRYDTRGWPDFPWWPNHSQMSHTGYYYKWIERAWLGGMRMMVSDLVENEVLCNVQKTVNPASWINPNSCNTMDSIRLQAQRIKEMEAYIDAQAGGPGKGFFRLVYSPAQARQVIADGKLAVVMGVEASETFNCGEKDSCSKSKIDTLLDELYNMGVRTIYPSHKFDNQFGGSHVEDGLINLGNWLATGYFFKTEECDEHTHGRHFKSGFPLIGDIPVFKQILDAAGANPVYDESIQHCNQRGISDLGVYLVNRMIDKKMLIELDHMSDKTAEATMDIVETRNYSGVISSHGWMYDGKNGSVHRDQRRLIEAGGYMSPMNSNAYSIENKISKFLDVVEQTDFVQGVGFSTDMSGLAGQPGPRGDTDTNPLDYPFTSEFGLIFDKQKSGNRTFDFNKDGIAHYGMVADHLQDIREQGSVRIYESIMNSAEAYLQMWERAASAPSTPHHNPL